MNTFTVQELYEISDALTERRTRLLNVQACSAFKNNGTLARFVRSAETAHRKVMDEIFNHTTEI